MLLRRTTGSGITGSLAVLLSALLTIVPVLPLAAQTPDRPASSTVSTLMRARALLAQGDARAARTMFAELAHANNADAQDALAAMWLEGIGGDADRQTAMYWFCRLAHQPRGGRMVMRALWFLAEYYRTGGGLPGRRYGDGRRALQNPVKAYFWYQVMARQADLYDTTVDEALKLGRVGSASVARELLDVEKQQVTLRVQRWSPAQPAGSVETCLNLPQARE